MIKLFSIVAAGFITTSAVAAVPQAAQPSAVATGDAVAAAPAAAAPTKLSSLEAGATPSKPKLICRSTTVTGSLIQQAKRCGTKEDWARAIENARGAAQQLVTSHAAGMTTF